MPKYLIYIAGPLSERYKGPFFNHCSDRFIDFGIGNDCFDLLDLGVESCASFDEKSPNCIVYFGGIGGAETPNWYESAKTAAVPILTVVDSATTRLNEKLPSALLPINAFDLSKHEFLLEPLVGYVFEMLSLNRTNRRLFISYRRPESSTVAMQLYEHFDSKAFDVFLDTHSIRSGEPFQEVLWHRLSDTDVMLMLDTTDFKHSRWTMEELGHASAVGVGIVQLVWPNHVPDTDVPLAARHYLDASDFETTEAIGTGTEKLSPRAIHEIAVAIETVRARSIAQRHANLVGECISSCYELGIPAILQPERHVLLSNNGSKFAAIVPVVGVPGSIRFHDFDTYLRERLADLDRGVGAMLLFDDRGVRPIWLGHLEWLGKHLPVKSVALSRLHETLQTITK